MKGEIDHQQIAFFPQLASPTITVPTDIPRLPPTSQVRLSLRCDVVSPLREKRRLMKRVWAVVRFYPSLPSPTPFFHAPSSFFPSRGRFFLLFHRLATLLHNPLSPPPPSFPKHLSLVRLALELSTSSTMTPGRSLLATCNLWLLEFDSSSDRPLSRGTTSSHHSIDSRTFHAKSIFRLGLVNFLCPPTKPFAVILHTLPIPFRVRLFRNHEEDFVRWISTKRIISDAFVEECHYSSCSRRVWNFDGVALYREGKF